MKVRQAPWVFPTRKSAEKIVRRMFCLAVEAMIIRIMCLHDYQFEDGIYRQVKGGSIGLDLTGVVSDVYMCYWDGE